MNNKRRIIIVLLSVTTGSFLAFLLMQSRMGTMKPEAWRQIGVNFFFALAIVLLVGLVLRKKNDKM